MVQSCLLLVSENEGATHSTVTGKNFSVGETCWTTDKQAVEHLYQQIVYKVLTNPKQLISHIQRIYFTYSQGLAEPLYAALVDLILVLDGRGKELSTRMVLSTRSLITNNQVEVLASYLEHRNASLLTDNKFSVLTKGLVGAGVLLTEKNKVAITHDPLAIARDYVEYSQLDAAIETLEAGVLEDLERQELQQDLLELYKVTKNIQAFTNMHDLLIEKKIDLLSGWQELSDYFAGLTNEE